MYFKHNNNASYISFLYQKAHLKGIQYIFVKIDEIKSIINIPVNDTTVRMGLGVCLYVCACVRVIVVFYTGVLGTRFMDLNSFILYVVC